MSPLFTVIGKYSAFPRGTRVEGISVHVNRCGPFRIPVKVVLIRHEGRDDLITAESLRAVNRAARDLLRSAA